MVRERYDDFYVGGVPAQGGLNPFREKMAWLPAGALPLHNPVGTAPGVLFTTTGKEEGERRALVDEAVRDLQPGLTALGIDHWERSGNPQGHL